MTWGDCDTYKGFGPVLEAAWQTTTYIKSEIRQQVFGKFSYVNNNCLRCNWTNTYIAPFYLTQRKFYQKSNSLTHTVQSKDMRLGLLVILNWPLVWMSLCVSPASYWQPVQGVPCLSAMVDGTGSSPRVTMVRISWRPWKNDFSIGHRPLYLP